MRMTAAWNDFPSSLSNINFDEIKFVFWDNLKMHYKSGRLYYDYKSDNHNYKVEEKQTIPWPKIKST